MKYIYLSKNFFFSLFGQLNFLWKSEQVNQQVLDQQIHLPYVAFNGLVKAVHTIVTKLSNAISPIFDRFGDHPHFTKLFDSSVQLKSLNIWRQITQGELKAFPKTCNRRIQMTGDQVLLGLQKKLSNARVDVLRHIGLWGLWPYIQNVYALTCIKSFCCVGPVIKPRRIVDLNGNQDAFLATRAFIQAVSQQGRDFLLMTNHVFASKKHVFNQAVRAVVFEGKHGA